MQQSAAIVHSWYKIYCNALHLPKSEKTICFFDVHVSCKNLKRGNWVLRTHCWKKKRPQSLPQWKWLLDQKPSSSPIFVIIVTIIIIIFLFESWKQASYGSSALKEKKKTSNKYGRKSDFTRNATVFGGLNLTCKIYWLRWTKMGLCSPLDMSGKSSKYRPGLWDFFGVTRETLGNSESTAKDRAVSLFHVHFIPAWHHHLHLTICQPSSPQHCHHHQHHHHVSYWNQCFMEKSIRHWFVTIYLFIIVNIMFPWIVTPIVTRWGVSGSLWFRLPQHYQMMNCPTASS